VAVLPFDVDASAGGQVDFHGFGIGGGHGSSIAWTAGPSIARDDSG
jgi:hypothetical protein